MSNSKVDEATTIAVGAIRDAAPALLTVTEAAEKVASGAGVSVGTARSRVRAAIEAGGLLELKPWSRKFHIELPGEKDAGVGPFYIAMEWTNTGLAGENRKVITTDDSKMRPSSYGPGNTTYVTDPELIREYVQQLADEKKAKEEAEREAYRAEKKAQSKEIHRRFPGLQRSLRTLRLLGAEIREPGLRFAAVSTNAYLEDPDRRKKETIEERDVYVAVNVYGDVNTAVFQAVLEAGVAAYIDTQPVRHCAHCAGRILQVPQGGDGGFWWHVETTNASCAEGDTKAEPAECST